eukprot:CAMPEP_0117758468 /NCGR_PEP_ID=MMETSP0947-20121206/15398_1 /TAXON_ID=44440 /ORGANISM="Chattonella subsalsa, Strain CCMP2191" /LENGTH=76 /DNA_ID=CAMNT_0005578665 /DNA_START=99 /DNA_END=329 /DNA_ORIENTATION=+
MEGGVVQFNVGMTCEGCANACKRILGGLPGVENVVTDVEKKQVLVQGNGETSPEVMLEALMKWSEASGKSVELVEA